MAKQRSRSSARKVLTILGVIVLVIAVIVGLGKWLATNQNNGGGGILNPTTPGGENQSQGEQPADCPAVEVIAAPGTWESSVTENPSDPTQFPGSLLLNVTRPLQQKYDASKVKVWTLNYPAQFRNINAMGEMTYDQSRQDGFNRTNAELSATHQRCPKTGFVLVGFSQGAVLAGDVLSDIGNGRGVIPAENILGATLIADGRRIGGLGQTVGYQPTGVGSEVALQPLGGLLGGIVPGATMRGARPGGFGSLQNQTNEICAKGDQVCDAPSNITDGPDAIKSILQQNSVHAQYATNPDVIPGTVTPAWIVNWASQIIDSHI